MKLWCGDEASQDALMLAQTQLQANQKLLAGMSIEDIPSPFQQVSSKAGILAIRGSLIPGRAGWLRLFGVMGYGDVVDGLVAAAESDVQDLIIKIDSTGGSTVDLPETARLIQRIGAVKNTYGFTSSTAASSGYWLYAATKETWLDPLAIVGSVGVMTSLRSYQKQMQDNGVDAEVIRSDRLKALGSPEEAISDEARAELQRIVTQAATFFKKELSALRPTLTDTGEGAVFLGADAVKRNFADRVGTFSQLQKTLKIA